MGLVATILVMGAIALGCLMLYNWGNSAMDATIRLFSSIMENLGVVFLILVVLALFVYAATQGAL